MPKEDFESIEPVCPTKLVECSGSTVIVKDITVNKEGTDNE